MKHTLNLFFVITLILLNSCTLDVSRRKLDGVFYEQMGYCMLDSHCKDNEFCQNKNCIDYNTYFKQNLTNAFAEKMIDNKYHYGFTDNNSYFFTNKDLIINLNKLDKKTRKMNFIVEVKPNEVKNTNNANKFQINPLFIINPNLENSCPTNTLSINLKNIYALTSEIFPQELLKTQGPLEPYIKYFSKLRFDYNKDLKTACQSDPSRKTLICDIVKSSNVSKVKQFKYKITSAVIDVDLEIIGKISIIKFNNKYNVCLNELFKSSEYNKSRTSNIAIFKILGEISR